MGETEIGVLGTPGYNLFGTGLALGFGGLVALGLSILFAFSARATNNNRRIGIAMGIVAGLLLLAALVILPSGYGKQRVGTCLDRLPAATLAVNGAFKLSEETLYIVVRGKSAEERIISRCSHLSMSTVKGYPGRPVAPGQYWVVVDVQKGVAGEETTHTFVPMTREDREKLE